MLCASLLARCMQHRERRRLGCVLEDADKGPVEAQLPPPAHHWHCSAHCSSGKQAHWCGKHHSLCCACCASGKHHCACYHPSAQTNVLCTTPTWPTWLAASVANLNMQTSAHCRLLIAHCIEVLRSATCTLHSKVRITHCTGLQHSVMLTKLKCITAGQWADCWRWGNSNTCSPLLTSFKHK